MQSQPANRSCPGGGSEPRNPSEGATGKILMPDYLYKNAPLIEVIAEIRWDLVHLRAIPGGAVDPHYQEAAEGLSRLLEERGYTHTEQLIPPELPPELTPGKPIVRFRRQPGKWPLYQFGPGVFTCNIVPPYGGWADFRSVVEAGFADLYEAYPSAEEILKVNLHELRYIDGFGKTHGVSYPTGFATFLKNELNIRLSLREGFVEQFSNTLDKVQYTGEFRFPLSLPENAYASVRFGPGKAKGEPIIMIELQVQYSGEPDQTSPDRILAWMDEAHNSLHDMFEAITSDALKEKMGPKQEIPDHGAE